MGSAIGVATLPAAVLPNAVTLDVTPVGLLLALAVSAGAVLSLALHSRRTDRRAARRPTSTGLRSLRPSNAGRLTPVLESSH